MPPNPANKPTYTVKTLAPHAATVAQARPAIGTPAAPHPATVAQAKPTLDVPAARPLHAAATAHPRSAFGAHRPPHPATVAQPKLPHLATIALPRSPHPATVTQPKRPPSASLTRASAQAKGGIDTQARAPAEPGIGECQVAQRYLQDVSEAQFGADVLAPQQSALLLRKRATDENWEKSGVEGKARERVTDLNTVIAAARLEWFDAGRRRATEDFGPHISGFPFGRLGEKHYRARRTSAYEQIPGCVRNCAERKLLLDIDAFIRGHGYSKMFRICLYLYSEKTPCEECERALVAWRGARREAQLFVCAPRILKGDSASTWAYRETSGISDGSAPALAGLQFVVFSASRIEAMPAPRAPISSAAAATGEAPSSFWGKRAF